MKKLREFLNKPYIANAFAVCCGVLLFVLLTNFGAVKKGLSSVLVFLSPVTTGIVFAYLVDPICVFFEKKLPRKISKPKSRHVLSVAITLFLLVLLLALLLFALIPSLTESISKLVSEWDYYTRQAQNLLARAENVLVKLGVSGDMLKVDTLIDKGMSKLVEMLKNNLQTVFSTLGSVGASVSNFAVGIGFGICFLFAKKGLLEFISLVRSSVRKEDKIKKSNEMYFRCHGIFIRYMGCTLLDSLIIGVATLIFALIMKMPYAPLLAVICALTNILPTFGPWIGTAMCTFFLVLDKPSNALWLFIFSCILQAVDGMLIKPILFKDSLGIPAVWSLILIVIGGKVAGIAGIILSIPFGAVFAILYHEYILPRLEKRKQRLAEKDSAGDSEQLTENREQRTENSEQ